LGIFAPFLVPVIEFPVPLRCSIKLLYGLYLYFWGNKLGFEGIFKVLRSQDLKVQHAWVVGLASVECLLEVVGLILCNKMRWRRANVWVIEQEREGRASRGLEVTQRGFRGWSRGTVEATTLGIENQVRLKAQL